jgi:hypothetical protein
LSRLLFDNTAVAVAKRAYCSVRIVRGNDVSRTGTVENASELQESKAA